MYKYTYIVLHGHVKHFRKNVIFTWGFGDRPTKMPIAKKNHQNMHPQIIKMNLQEESMVINVVELSIK
jgi:hypothetical protein